MILDDRRHEQGALTELGLGVPAERLFPLVYEELRALSHSWFRRLPKAHTLQPTAVVHEAFLRLAAHGEANWQDCAHFKAVAAKAMRQVLADYGRRRKREKRGAGFARVSLCEAEVPSSGPPTEVAAEALTGGLEALAKLHERQAAVVEMRYLGGMTTDEVARVLGVSKRTVVLDWKMARAWLLGEVRRRCEG